MASLSIVRLPGEDEADFQRRYAREKMRIYRARRPKQPRKTRDKNSAKRPDATFTDEEWLALRQWADEPDDDYRRRYGREKMKLWRAKHPDHVRAKSRIWHHTHAGAEADRFARYKARNGQKIKASQKAYFDAHKERRIAALKAWREDNPERYAEIRKRWYDDNQALRNAYSAAWRRACREQTPPWADFEQIRAFYEEAVRLTAETGIEHHVDHIIPLRGRNVRGLHVQTNLRVIPAVENMRKHNTLVEDLIAA